MAVSDTFKAPVSLSEKCSEREINMYKRLIIHLIYFHVVIFFIINCSVNKQLVEIKNTENQAVVAGNILVYYNGEDITSETTILFNEISWGKYSYKPGVNHRIMTYLPLGESHIARLAYKNFRINIDKEHSSFLLKDAGKINYIGNIYIDWRGDDSKMPNMFGLLGALADEAVPDGQLKVFVENNEQDIRNFINQHYGSDYELVANIIKAVPYDSSKRTIIASQETYVEGPKNYTFKLHDGRKIRGRLIGKKDGELYINNRSLVYIVNKENLAAVLDGEDDVTDDILAEAKEESPDSHSYHFQRVE